jgi:uncharacterized membrane protein YidH (DUF202 family)
VDSSGSPRRGRAAAVLATLAAVLGLIALVAVASGGDTPSGSAGSTRPSHLLIDTLVSLYIVLMAFGLVVFVWLYFLRRESAYERARLRQRGRLRSLVFLALVLGAFALALRIAENRNDLPQRQIGPADIATPADDAGPRRGYEPEFALVPVLIVVGLVGTAAVSLAIASRRRRRALGDRLGYAELAEALEDVLAESLDDLRAERDPRKAVVAAYARLERTLAAYGLPRRAAEAPAEFLARILASLEVSHRSIGRLTALFERAKFSQHEVDVGMKEEAIDALETTRDELREARERELAERAAALAAARDRAAGA